MAKALSDDSKDFQVRIAALEGFLILMSELGADGVTLLRSAGIDPEALDQPDLMISYRSFLAALGLARDVTGLQHIGLLLAERQPLSMLGPLGFAIAQAPDVRSAIRQLNDFFHLHNTGGSASLVVEGDVAMWRYEVLVSGVPGVRQQEDLASAIGVNILRSFLGREWSPELVTLQRRAPMNSAPYRQAFRCPVEFEAEHNQAVFDRALLDHKVAAANNQLHAILNSYLRGLDASGRLDFASEVQQIILQAMKGGDSSLPRVARLLGTSARTLQRRLAEEGSSFRRELDMVRSRVAVRYLEETRISLTNLALTLGYSDLAAFSHAFRRAMGSSPSRWRSVHRLDSFRG